MCILNTCLYYHNRHSSEILHWCSYAAEEGDLMLINAVQGCTKLFWINKTPITMFDLKVVPTYHFRVWSFVPTLQKSNVSVLKTQRNGELQLKNLKPCMNECQTPLQYFRDSEHTDSCSAVCLIVMSRKRC